MRLRSNLYNVAKPLFLYGLIVVNTGVIEILNDYKTLQCNGDVTKCNTTVTFLLRRDREEIEIDIEMIDDIILLYNKSN